jgi:hypothetical protein
MDSTVVVAGMGLTATVLGTWLTARSHRKTEFQGRLLEARLRVYAECSDSLNEYARASYNRARARLASLPEEHREPLRQGAYRCNARARSAIDQVRILSGDVELASRLRDVRNHIGDLANVVDRADLTRQQERIFAELSEALGVAQRDLSQG